MPKYLFKANNDVISHCECDNEPAMSEGQMDCPWCGCGWLISCTKCAKAFTYAQVRETDLTLGEISRRDAARRGLKDVSDEMHEKWADWMTQALAGFELGQIVVYVDGHYLPIDATDVSFSGFHAHHSFNRLPHAEALQQPERLRDVLGKREYWTERERPDRY